MRERTTGGKGDRERGGERKEIVELGKRVKEQCDVDERRETDRESGGRGK